MEIAEIPENLKSAMRMRFLSGLKSIDAVDLYELELFRWFRDETERTWASMEAKEQRYIKEQSGQGAEDINDSGLIAADYYCKRMRYSHVIFLTTILEGAMKQECARLSKALGPLALFELRDLKGGPWTVKKLFLERYGHFEVSDVLWTPIKQLLNVRNAIVHHSGDLLPLTEEQSSSLQKIKGISLNSNEVQIDNEYVDLAIAAVQEALEFIHNEVDKVIDSAVAPRSVT